MKKVAFSVSLAGALVFCAGLCMAQVPTAEYAPDANTIGLWHFNEGAGALTDDASASNNDGTITGATWTGSGKFGNALSFDGVGDGVQIARPFPGIQNNFTIEAWFKIRNFPSIPTDAGEIFRNRGNFGDIRVIILSIRVLIVEVWDAVGGGHSYHSTTILQSDTWYHFSVTYDGAKFRIFLNGCLDLEQADVYNYDWNRNYIADIEQLR